MQRPRSPPTKFYEGTRCVRDDLYGIATSPNVGQNASPAPSRLRKHGAKLKEYHLPKSPSVEGVCTQRTASSEQALPSKSVTAPPARPPRATRPVLHAVGLHVAQNHPASKSSLGSTNASNPVTNADVPPVRPPRRQRDPRFEAFLARTGKATLLEPLEPVQSYAAASQTQTEVCIAPHSASTTLTATAGTSLTEGSRSPRMSSYFKRISPHKLGSASSPSRPSEAAKSAASSPVTQEYSYVLPDLDLGSYQTAEDDASEAYQRDRRFTSLLKGLGIEPVSSTTEIGHLHKHGVNAQKPPPHDVKKAPAVETKAAVKHSLETEIDEWGIGYPDTEDENQVRSGTVTLLTTRRDLASQLEAHSAGVSAQNGSNQLEDDRRRSKSSRRSRRSSHSSSRTSASNRRSRQQSTVVTPAPPDVASVTTSEKQSGRRTSDPRASLGMSESVLAGILALDPFRMSAEIRPTETVSPPDKFDESIGSVYSTQSGRSRSSRVDRLVTEAGRAISVDAASIAAVSQAAHLKPAGNNPDSVAETPPVPEHFKLNSQDIAPVIAAAVQSVQPSIPASVRSQSSGVNQDTHNGQSHSIAAGTSGHNRKFVPSSTPLHSEPVATAISVEGTSASTDRGHLGHSRSRSSYYLGRLASSISTSFGYYGSQSCQNPKRRTRLPSIFGGPEAVQTALQQDASASDSGQANIKRQNASMAPVEIKRQRSMTGPSRLSTHYSAPRSRISTGDPNAKSVRIASPVPSPALATHTWRSTLSNSLTNRLEDTHTTAELRRQEVIWELIQTEQAFVNGLRGVVKVFSTPLRMPNGQWIAGIPRQVSDLLDWLDDIIVLHTHIASALQECRDSQIPIVWRIAEAFLLFIPRLEIYQPYLVSFEHVNHEIEAMIADATHEFGEFVRMQQMLPECGAMTLSSFLLKPVQRLMKYSLFFKQLCDLTPAPHLDYEATVLLFQATDSIIRTMQEVKAREEEYLHIKSFSHKIVGLPTNMTLPKRDRQLLASGMLRRVHLGDKERHYLGIDELTGSFTLLKSHGPSVAPPNLSSVPLASPAFSLDGVDGSPSPFLIDGHSPAGDSGAWGVSPRPPSTMSEMSSAAMSAFTDYDFQRPTQPSRAASPLMYAESQHSHLRPDSLYSHSGQSLASPTQSQFASPQSAWADTRQRTTTSHIGSPLVPQTGSEGGKMSSPYLGKTSRAVKCKETPIFVFIFSDLVVFATRHSEGPSLRLRPSKADLRDDVQTIPDRGTRYRVQEDWGVARVAGVHDLRGKAQHHPSLMQVDLLPIWSDEHDFTSAKSTEDDEMMHISSEYGSAHSRKKSNWSAAMRTSIFLTVPEPSSSSAGPSPQLGSTPSARKKDRGKIISAFQTSCMTAARLARTQSLETAVATSQPSFHSVTSQPSFHSATPQPSFHSAKSQPSFHSVTLQPSLYSAATSQPMMRGNGILSNKPSLSRLNTATNTRTAPIRIGRPRSPSVIVEEQRRWREESKSSSMRSSGRPVTAATLSGARSLSDHRLMHDEVRQFWSDRVAKVKRDMLDEQSRMTITGDVGHREEDRVDAPPPPLSTAAVGLAISYDDAVPAMQHHPSPTPVMARSPISARRSRLPSYHFRK